VALLLLLIALGSSVSALYLSATLAESEANRKAARLELGKSLSNQGAAVQRTGLLGQRFESLKLLALGAGELRDDPKGREFLPQIRDHAITALGLTDLKPLWERPLDVVINLETSQCDYRLERYAFVDYNGTKEIIVRQLDSNAELLRLPTPRVNFWHSQMDFSPDGQYLLAWYCVRNQTNQILHVWHLGRKERIFDQPVRCGAVLLAAAIHPNGRWLLFSRPDGAIGVWDLEEGREIKRLPLGFAPYSLCLDPAGKRVAANRIGTLDAPLVKILDLETGQELASWNSQAGTYAMAWSSDGQLLASGSGDGRIYVWHVPRREVASVLQGHSAGVIHAQFAHAGHLLATWSWDGTTRLWDAASGEALVTTAGSFWRFSADDRHLAYRTGTAVGTWEVAHGRECRTLHHGMTGDHSENRKNLYLRWADFSPDNRLLATVGSDGVRLWEADTGRELAHLITGAGIIALFHPDGQSLITLSARGLYRWPIRPVALPEGIPSGRGASPVREGRDAEVVQIGPPQFIRDMGADQTFWHAVWMPDHRAIAVADNANARVVVVDLSDSSPATSQPVVLTSEHKRMYSIAVSPDGQWVASGGWKERGIQVWNLATRRLERVLPPCDGRGDIQFTVNFSPDGRWLVCAADNNEASGYHFWRVGTWQRELVIRTETRVPTFPAFSRDRRLLDVKIAPQQILLADPADGRSIARLSTLQPLDAFACAFSPDGSKLVAVSTTRTFLMWDLRLVRDRLAAMDLDWDRPGYDEKPRTVDAARSPPLEMHVFGEIPEPNAKR